jgi:hypothetical protein
MYNIVVKIHIKYSAMEWVNLRLYKRRLQNHCVLAKRNSFFANEKKEEKGKEENDEENVIVPGRVIQNHPAVISFAVPRVEDILVWEGGTNFGGRQGWKRQERRNYARARGNVGGLRISIVSLYI